jgi:hypothetical protein
MTFAPYTLTKNDHDLGGIQYTIKFPNGYGASIVTGSRFFRATPTTFEVAVIHNDDVCYDTGIASDVLGYQTSRDVVNILRRIEALPERR